MPKVPVPKPDQADTFSSYFDLPFEPEDVLAEFGYTFGELWQFALLDRPNKSIYLDPYTYPYPDEVDRI